MLVHLAPSRLFVAQCTFDERHELKNRGWIFGNGTWWTDDAKKLIGLPCAPDAIAHARFKLSRFEKSSATHSDFFVPAPVGKEFAPYQRAAIEIMVNERNTLLADPPGIGKTATVIGYCNVTQPQRIYCSVPASVRTNWVKEFKEWSTQRLNILVIDGRKIDKIPQNTNLIVSSYDLLTQPYLMQLINDWHPQVLVVDEGHALKEATAQRTKSVFSRKPFKDVNHIHGLIHRCQKFIDVTGTPALNRPVEFYPLLSACAKQAIAPYDDFMSFGKHFCAGFKAKFGWVFTGASNEAQLNRILRESIMIRRDKEKLLPQLPSKRFQIIEVDPKKVTNLLESEFQLELAMNHLDWVENLETTVKAADLKKKDDDRPLIAQLAEIKQELALSKVPQVAEIVDAVAHAGEKVVVFAVHKKVVEALNEALKAYYPALVIGGQSKEKRDSELQRFISSPECGVIIGNIDAMGTGIDGLQHVCCQIVFAEINHSPNTYGAIGQAIDRLCRRGQKNPVLARFIAYSNSLDQLMLTKNAHKEIILGKLLK